MVDPELLEILVCPETGQPVRPADDALLDRVNRSVESGEIRNRGGEKIQERIDGGLVRDDGTLLYPVRDDIPIMLVDEAIPLDDV